MALDTISTDAVANDLAIRLFLFGVAAMSFYEAWKTDRPKSYIPWLIFAIFLIAGIFLDQIGQLWPVGLAYLGRIASDPTSWFVLFIALFFVLRPLWAKPTGVSQTGNGEPVDLAAMVDARLEEFLVTKLRGEFATHAHLHAHDEKLTDLAQKVRSAQGSAQHTLDFAKREVACLDERMDEVAEASSNLQRTWDDWTRQHTDSQELRFEWVDGGFRAIWHREQLDHHASMIESQAKLLLRIRDGESVDNWDEWESMRANWLSGVGTWADIAERYCNGVRAHVMSVETEQLQGNWPEHDSAFPSVDVMMSYRKTAVILGQFRSGKSQVNEAVNLAAFWRPSLKGNPNILEGGGDA